MAALMIIPLLGLTLFLAMAKSIFERDKIAYVFDSSLSVSKTRAARVSSEIASMISVAQAIVLNYRADTKNLAESGTYFFDREAKFEAFRVYAWNQVTSQYDLNVDLSKPNGKRLLEGRDAIIDDALKQAKARPVVVRSVEGTADRVVLAARFGEVSDLRHVIAIAVFDATELAEVFNDSGRHASFLSRKDTGAVVLSASSRSTSWEPAEIWGTLSAKKTPEGIEELMISRNDNYLASFAEVGIGDLVVISMVEKSAALAAVAVLLRKSALFFILVIAVTMIIAVFASRGMTFALFRLSEATKRIAEGDFAVRVEVGSGGEIGQLAKSFNTMAGEVSRLMRETAEKARMESELATARTVQETLFPESLQHLGAVEIAGHYVPASECGGDWWFYCENGDKVYIWIGDATGHGAPAALVTSAARAVVSVITSGPEMPVGECLSVMNRAIYDTSKGKMMMTFFLACIDRSSGVVSYSNASHEAPLVLRARGPADGEAKRSDFEPIIDVNNPRLGEQPDRVFKESKLQLADGDTIVFYTDGVVDLKNPETKQLGERRFMKMLASGLSGSTGLPHSLGTIVQALEDFRTNVPLDDDVTLILCRYQSTAAGLKEEAS
jgi:sigma-B regulation protein RsbU (phosphoserine phosphatase)